NGQHLAHLLYGIYLSVLFYEPVYEPSPLEKMAMAFFNMSRSSSVSLSFLRKILNCYSSELILGLSRSVLPPLKRGFLHHLLSRLGSDIQLLGYRCYRAPNNAQLDCHDLK